MLSTYTSYSLYSRDIGSALKRVANDPIVARDAKYYADNIGKVKNVDEFLKNYRLFSYAMKAHGLEEMTYAKAFMKQVLESDLNDPDSFANKLTDTKYRTFAAAYDFGNIEANKVVQTESQQDRLIAAYHDTIEQEAEELKEETRYYNIVIDQVDHVDDIFHKTRLRNYVFKSFGIDPETFNYEHIKGILTSDISDPNSYVNATYTPKIAEWQGKIDVLRVQRQQNGLSDDEKAKIDYLLGQYNKSVGDARKLFEMSAAFNFQPDGKVDTGMPAQTAAQKRLINETSVLSNPRLTQAGAILNRDYFAEKMKTITDVNQITADPRMVKMLTVAFNLPEFTTTNVEIRWALSQDPDDPNSPIHLEKDKGLIDMARAFSFQADGTVAAGEVAQSDGQLSSMMNLYFSRYNDKDEAADAKAIKDFKRYIGLTKNLDDFLSSAQAAVTIRTFALAAFDIDPNELSPFKLKRILTSDLSDPKSYVYQMKDDRFVRLAKAFNFDEKGKIGAPRLAQAENEITRISRDYITEKTRWDKDKSVKKKAEEEAEYYRGQMETIETVDQLLGNRRLLDFMLVAEGLDPKTVKTDYLKKIFKSDLSDPKSFANTGPDSRFRGLVGSFNFDAKGKITYQAGQSIQNKRGLMETQEMYLRQSLEEQAGEENTGVRLALYFKRVVNDITTPYDILSDNALSEFIRTAFSIPAEMSNTDVDMQAKIIEKNLDMKDLRDPKKVEKLVNRFLAMFDIDNAAPDPMLMLLGGGGGSISGDTLATLAQLKMGRRGSLV
jgi:hypothetical protein